MQSTVSTRIGEIRTAAINAGIASTSGGERGELVQQLIDQLAAFAKQQPVLAAALYRANGFMHAGPWFARVDGELVQFELTSAERQHVLAALLEASPKLPAVK